MSIEDSKTTLCMYWREVALEYGAGILAGSAENKKREREREREERERDRDDDVVGHEDKKNKNS